MKTLFSKMNKSKLKPLMFILVFSLVGKSVFAVDCSGYSAEIQDPKTLGSVLYLICPLQGFINFALYFVGAVLVILVLYGAIKAVTSTGDPKQLEGAKLTWNYALFGFVIIIGSVALITIILALLGRPFSPTNIIHGVEDVLNKLYNDIYSNLPGAPQPATTPGTTPGGH